jgi:hypothetical protein
MYPKSLPPSQYVALHVLEQSAISLRCYVRYSAKCVTCLLFFLVASGRVQQDIVDRTSKRHPTTHLSGTATQVCRHINAKAVRMMDLLFVLESDKTISKFARSVEPILRSHV